MAQSTMNTPRVKMNQRSQKCYPLESVPEHCVRAFSETSRSKPQYAKKRRIKDFLVRIRDKYVNMMNNIACSADLTGFSTGYACSTGPMDLLSVSVMTNMKNKEKEEMLEAIRFLEATSRG